MQKKPAQLRSIFQLTTSRGGRPITEQETATTNSFQLTTSRGGRLHRWTMRNAGTAFQLTTSRGGRRSIPGGKHTRTGISTHDLTRRSTLARSQIPIS